MKRTLRNFDATKKQLSNQHMLMLKGGACGGEKKDKKDRKDKEEADAYAYAGARITGDEDSPSGN